MNFVSKLLQVLAFVPSIITTVENLIGHKTGAEKKDAVMSFLQTALSAGDSLMSREIVDQDKFQNGLSQIITGTVQCLNASIWASGQKTSDPSPVSSQPGAIS